MLGCFGEDGQTDLPSRRVGAKLVEVIEGLRFEGLVRGMVPGDFYCICYLGWRYKVRVCVHQNFQQLGMAHEGLSVRDEVGRFLKEMCGIKTYLIFHLRPAGLPSERKLGKQSGENCFGEVMME